LIQALKMSSLSFTGKQDLLMFDDALNAPTLNEIRAAANLLMPYIIRTPLLRLNLCGTPNEIYVKLENLQPIGAFKLRCMGNAMLTADDDALRDGVYTASSGNAGIGLAWMAAKLGVTGTVYAPASGPSGKLRKMQDLGAQVHLLGDDQWWQMIVKGGHATDPGFYVDAVRNTSAMAGNGTIGLEIIEQLPDVDSIIVPFGGGGLMCGIASAIRALKPDTRIIVAESDAASPLTAALAADRPVTVPVRPSFISGAGAPSVLDEMWPLVKSLVDRTAVVSVTEVADAIRLLFDLNRVVAEGAGAIAVAGALSGECGSGKTVCVVTGGNIDSNLFSSILSRQAI
jgi:threonine dehydratase